MFLFATSIASGCSKGAALSQGLPTGSLIIGSAPGQVTVHVEIAETDSARRIGLMKRTALAADAGMVFLFDGPTDTPFWMKDTLIPLSAAFWDAEGNIVSMLDMQPCRADPCPQYSPGTSYVGAVEVNIGFLAAHEVEVGEHVELER